MKKLYIIRGIPGSGKTTLARELVPANCVCEADQFFENLRGEYKFDKSKLNDAHKWCQTKVRHLMQMDVPRIAVSNTFIQIWEIVPYIELAWEFGYQITEISLTSKNFGSIHNVPEEVIERMKRNWEP